MEVSRNELDELTLPDCFHYSDSYANYITNKNREVILTSTCVDKSSTSNSLNKYIARYSKSLHYCLICKKKFQTDDNKDSNIKNHIKNMHYEDIPIAYQDLTPKFINSCILKWKSTQSKVDSLDSSSNKVLTTDSKGQANNGFMTSHFAPIKPVIQQQQAIVRAISLGLLPLTFLHNKGNKTFLFIIIKILHSLYIIIKIL